MEAVPECSAERRVSSDRVESVDVDHAVPRGTGDALELVDASLLLTAAAPREGVGVVRAIGEVDLLTAPDLRRFLDAAVRTAATERDATGKASSGRVRRGFPRVVCDLSAVTFLGASGLAVLIEVAERSVRRGVDLRVVAAGGPAGRLLALTGLDHHLVVEARLDRAVASDLIAPAPAPRAAS